MNTLQYLISALLVYMCSAVNVRKDINSLTPEETLKLRKALESLKLEKGAMAYSTLASYHGYPPQCSVDLNAYACCLHGISTFPQWHRMYVVQLEQALIEKGLTIGIPYWDWTKLAKGLPALLDEPTYEDGGQVKRNPWVEGEINIAGVVKTTNRSVDNRLWSNDTINDLIEQLIHAMEYTNYCQFEVQFEVVHNVIHYLIGGDSEYSMSRLEYASYDPLFFTHHSNLDRIHRIYEALYKGQGHVPGTLCESDCEVCDIKSFQDMLQPFNRDSNPINMTRFHATGFDVTDITKFDYNYDNLSLNGLSIEDIRKRIDDNKQSDRAFAVFRLNGIKTSANIRMKVCKPAGGDNFEDTCQPAGDIFVLGGPSEMPWQFARPYYHEITNTVMAMGLNLQADYYLTVEIYSANGDRLSDDILPPPSIEFRPAVGKIDPPLSHDDVINTGTMTSLRRDADYLYEDEGNQLRKAMKAVKSDKTQKGYQAIAAFHGEPSQCPNTTAARKFSCCLHGAPTFPHWHRLFVLQLEDSLGLHSSGIGMPYWDWSKPNPNIPSLATDKTYEDMETHKVTDNPFFDAPIEFLKPEVRTQREWPHSFSIDLSDLNTAVLFALEQDNFCDFEVQFEVAHNLIHGMVGGVAPYGMNSLEYSAYDPLFYMHHSFLDKLWSLWMAMQEKRGKPYKAHCAQSYVHQPLTPFSFSTTYNPNMKTYSHSTPTNIYDHRKELHYTYDKLDFNGMNAYDLDNYIKTWVATNPRIFAGVLLRSFNRSAKAVVQTTRPNGYKYPVGSFYVLGGATEMPWRFDRLYKIDITKTMKHLNLNWKDQFDLSVEMFNFDGTPIEDVEMPLVQLIYKAPETAGLKNKETGILRKNVHDLSDDEMKNLRDALKKLQEETSDDSFEEIAGYHGAPYKCPDQGDEKYACLDHGVPVFPHWHRLLSIQFERALSRHGATFGIPYWDWTDKFTELPKLFKDADGNPFYSYHIKFEDKWTVREVDSQQLNAVDSEGTKQLFHSMLDVLEEDDFCDFEIQFEVLHNKLHAIMGGTKKYSMATLEFTAFDPLFMILHSSFDRLWAMWQELQQLRRKPKTAQCGFSKWNMPLEPFSYPDVNTDNLTRENSLPSLVADHRRFGYKFDKLNLNDFSISDIEDKIRLRKGLDRVYVGLMLSGQQKSFTLELSLQGKPLGTVNILGGQKEKVWAYERPYKHDITDELKEAQLTTDKPLKIHFKSVTYDKTESNEFETEVFLIERPAGSQYDILVIPITSQNLLPRPSKVVIKKGTRVKFVTVNVQDSMEDLGTAAAYDQCQVPQTSQRSYKFNEVHSLSPGNYYMSPLSQTLCQSGVKIHILVEDE
nr:hemocyanin-like 1 [Bulinus globosus]